MAGPNREESDAEREEPRRRSLSDLVRFQKPMLRVLLALAPAFVASLYFFGWRSLAVVIVSTVTAVFAEWLFVRKREEPISSAALVTASLFALTMPPRVPYMVVIVGAAVGIVFGKEVFGGYGRNIFNPALVGRCFVYICFPREMTAQWVPPFGGWPGGLGQWVMSTDAVTSATPMKSGGAAFWRLFVGNVGGCLGETSALLILLGAAYLIATRTASWRVIVWCVIGAACGSAAFHYGGAESVPDPVTMLISGGFLFGAVFMATDPISAAQTNGGRVIYGFMVGLLTVIIRGFSGWTGGTMFAILLMNTFNPLIDHGVREYRSYARSKKEAAKPEAAE